MHCQGSEWHADDNKPASQPASQLACQVFPAQSGPMDAVELAVLDQHAKARAQTPGITPYARAIHRGRSAPSAEQ
jgi:hypothetical protein